MTPPGEAGSCRLFFALWPDEATRGRLVAATRQAVSAAGGQPVNPAGYHITLAFLGLVPAHRLPDLAAAVAPLAPATGPLVLDRFGWFRRAQVFWLGPPAPSPDLTALVAGLWDRVAGLGLALPRDATPGGQGYAPHLTLCRKVRRQPDVPPPEPVRWQPRDFVLVESVTGAGGARYRLRARFAGTGTATLSP